MSFGYYGYVLFDVKVDVWFGVEGLIELCWGFLGEWMDGMLLLVNNFDFVDNDICVFD